MTMQTTTEQVHSLRSSAGYWLTLLARTMEADFDGRLAAYDVTRGSWAVLSAICHHEKRTPTELAAFVGIDGAAITRQLDRLVKQGLVARRRSSQDRRSIVLKLTEKGLSLIPQIAAESMATNEKYLAGLTAEEAKFMQTIIKKMLSNADVVPHDL